jgi:phage tail sheath protein FI
VRGFFENGGQACYVVPLAANTPAALASGLAAIANLNTIDLVCAPDAGLNAADFCAMQQLIVDHCQQMQDRFAILDAARGVDADKVWQQWSDIDGTNGALYYPWIKVAGFKDEEVVTVPPCGHVAGVYARTDKSRGVHKAPANEVMEEVIDLEIRISNATQASLNAKRINCIRSFPGRGIRIWGARTLSGHDRWTYVNVRRLFLTTARWIDWNMQYVPFEPNDSRLWTRVERDLRDYFYGLYRLGALKGETPQEAFYVRCNAETNTPESRDRGEVVAEIGLAPAVPYEFIVVRLIRGEKGVRISEAGQSAQNL